MTDDKHLSSSKREIFILRLWHRHESPAWIAEVQHVDSGQITHVRNAGELLRYLESYLRPTGPDTTPKDL